MLDGSKILLVHSLMVLKLPSGFKSTLSFDRSMTAADDIPGIVSEIALNSLATLSATRI